MPLSSAPKELWEKLLTVVKRSATSSAKQVAIPGLVGLGLGVSYGALDPGNLPSKAVALPDAAVRSILTRDAYTAKVRHKAVVALTPRGSVKVSGRMIAIPENIAIAARRDPKVKKILSDEITDSLTAENIKGYLIGGSAGALGALALTGGASSLVRRVPPSQIPETTVAAAILGSLAGLGLLESAKQSHSK